MFLDEKKNLIILEKIHINFAFTSKFIINMASRKSKSEMEREKVIQNRLQELLTRMLQDEDNKYCVDCDAKGKKIDAIH